MGYIHDGYCHRVRIQRNYFDADIRFNVRVSELPLHNAEPFRDDTRSVTAIHDFNSLLGILSQSLGDRGKALVALDGAVSGKEVDVHLWPHWTRQLVDQLCRSSAPD